MVRIHTLNIEPAIVNSSCAWASDYEQLRELYDSPYTGAVITRTTTFNGFSEDESNTVAFVKNHTSTVNSYGYSPHPLSSYLDWVFTLLTTPMLDGSPPTKPVIISITASTPTVLAEMLNTSCPNIKEAPPPAYTFPFLLPHLDALSSAFYADPTLTIGLKLPPYLYQTRFHEVIRHIHSYTRDIRPLRSTPPPAPASPSPAPSASPFALPPALGGLGGDALHPLALGTAAAAARMRARARASSAARRCSARGLCILV
ncbi:uncharacterized protein BXZ73DRAFT_90728 [Epithele typhae]|uniref:uncharacterized protein n=1 Tax=Epithele typhae TaxID=378194 RepID=UPI0020087345|nr:uncharacterized protein BXZ73DRAFT_90728 [Epithele typhae]KAH9927452.1 hypothetical protein BXZ73DRAFT_90728 [Epithele typhae]